MFETKDIPPSFRTDLSGTEKATVKSWVDNSDPFNFALRGITEHPFFNGDQKAIDAALVSAGILSEIIDKSELQQAYSVTRGLGQYDVDQVKTALKEKEKLGYSPLISDAGFIAVTFDDKVSLDYSEPDDNEEYYILKSYLVKGSKALFIGNQNDFTKRVESEILLQKGSSYYIIEEDIVVITDETGRERLVHYIDVVFIKE